MSHMPHRVKATPGVRSRGPHERAGNPCVLLPSGGSAAPAEHLLYVDDLLRVTCTITPGPSVIRLDGEVDSGNHAEVLATLEQARHIDEEFILDVGGVTFVDVSGLRALLAFAQGGGVSVRNTPHQMGRLMGLLDLPPFG